MKHLYIHIGLVLFSLATWNLNTSYANMQPTELNYAAVQPESVSAYELLITDSV